LEAADKTTILAAEKRLQIAKKGCASSSSSDSDSSDTEDGSSSDSDQEIEDLSIAASAVLEPKPEGRCTGLAMVSNIGAVVGQTVDLPPSVYGFGDYDVAMRCMGG